MKNVEIDHIGAYLCGHKLSELLVCHYNDKIGRENCEILCFKVSEKWRLFCFVLFWLGLGKVLCSKSGKIVKNNYEIVKKNDERTSVLFCRCHYSLQCCTSMLHVQHFIVYLSEHSEQFERPFKCCLLGSHRNFGHIGCHSSSEFRRSSHNEIGSDRRLADCRFCRHLSSFEHKSIVRSSGQHHVQHRRLADRRFCRHLSSFEHKSSKSSKITADRRFCRHLSSFEHKSSKSSKIKANIIVIAVFHLFKHKSSKTTADLIAIVVRMAIFHLSFEHKSSKSSKIKANIIVMAVFYLFKHKSSKTTADLIAIVVRMAIFHLFKHENKNKTKQTPLLQIFQMPFSTFKEHFETIIMQIKEL